jgi:caffeoyl-CoA O-methyltransferase
MNISPKPIEDYCRAHTTPLPAVFDTLRDDTYGNLGQPQMQVGLLEGRFLSVLVGITGARRVLEFGTFSGFSALAMASALPEDGELITCDIDERPLVFAKKAWDASPHGQKIKFRLGRGLDTVKTITGPFDLAFIDADKENYENYWDATIPLMRQGGLIVVDNVLWSGKVLDPQEKSDKEIAAFNEKARKDPRLEMVMLPVRDGMLLARVK